MMNNFKNKEKTEAVVNKKQKEFEEEKSKDFNKFTRQIRPIDITTISSLIELFGISEQNKSKYTHFFNDNWKNNYSIFNSNTVDISTKANKEQKQKINIFKKDIYNNSKSPFIFSFESLKLLEIIFLTTFSQKILSVNSGIKELSYTQVKQFEEELIRQIDSTNNHYGILRIKNSKSYFNTLFSHLFIHPFFDQLKIFIELFSDTANYTHKSKLFFKVMTILNSAILDFIILDFDDKELKYITNYELLGSNILSLDEQIIKNISIENILGFISPSFIHYSECNLSDSEYTSTKTLTKVLDRDFPSAQNFRANFYSDLKNPQKNNLKILEEYFNRIPNQYVQSSVICNDKHSDLYKAKATDSNLFDIFYEKNSEFIRNLDPILDDEVFKELLKKIDDFLVTQSTNSILVDETLDEINNSKQQIEKVNTKIKKLTNLTQSTLNKNNVEKFRVQYLELLKLGQKQKEKELDKIKLKIEHLNSIDSDDLISMVNKKSDQPKKTSTDNLNTDIEKILDLLYQFQKNNL